MGKPMGAGFTRAMIMMAPACVSRSMRLRTVGSETPTVRAISRVGEPSVVAQQLHDVPVELVERQDAVRHGALPDQWLGFRIHSVSASRGRYVP